jgi:hypothetical protein
MTGRSASFVREGAAVLTTRSEKNFLQSVALSRLA